MRQVMEHKVAPTHIRHLLALTLIVAVLTTVLLMLKTCTVQVVQRDTPSRLCRSQQVTGSSHKQQHSITPELQQAQNQAAAVLLAAHEQTAAQHDTAQPGAELTASQDDISELAPAAAATTASPNSAAEQCKQYQSLNNGSLQLLDNDKYFTAVVQALQDVLTSMQVPHEVVDNPSDDDDQHIYLTFMAHEPLPTGKRFIIYNFEQLEGRFADPDPAPDSRQAIFERRLRQAELVLDYSAENVRFLKERRNMSAVHVPYGFVPRFDGHLDHQKRDINILFLGEVNQQRRERLQPVIDLPHNPQPDIVVQGECAGSGWLFQGRCWGEEQHLAVYDRTKVAVNIHYYQGKTVLEVHRLIPLIANRVLVVSERSGDPWYDGRFKDLVTFSADPFDMANKVQELLDMQPADFDKLAEERHQLLVSTLQYKELVAQSGLFVAGGC